MPARTLPASRLPDRKHVWLVLGSGLDRMCAADRQVRPTEARRGPEEGGVPPIAQVQRYESTLHDWYVRVLANCPQPASGRKVRGCGFLPKPALGCLVSFLFSRNKTPCVSIVPRFPAFSGALRGLLLSGTTNNPQLLERDGKKSPCYKSLPRFIFCWRRLKPGMEDAFGIEETAGWVLQNGLKRVALQFPDDMLSSSVDVASSLGSMLG